MIQSIILLFLLCTTNAVASSHHPEAFLNDIAGRKDEGSQIVSHFCANCHAEKPMIPLGAPRSGVIRDWEPRLKMGFETLFNHTAEGLNAMPARGGCFECSDEQLILAILDMLPESAPISLIPSIKPH